MIVGLLLAAGGSTRFGSQKLIAMVNGVSLVRHGADVLVAATDVLVAVVGHESSSVRVALDGSGAMIVENSDWAQGLSSSLRCGVAALPANAAAVVIALGDQPQVDTRVVAEVIAAWRSTGRPIVSARYRGVRGHPVLFAREMFAELAMLSGDAGARMLIERTPERVAYVDVDSAVPRDVDSRDDLAGLDDRSVHSPRSAKGGNVGPQRS